MWKPRVAPAHVGRRHLLGLRAVASRDALENAQIEGHETLMEARKRMVEACESMEVFGEGNIVHDLFVKEG